MGVVGYALCQRVRSSVILLHGLKARAAISFAFPLVRLLARLVVIFIRFVSVLV